MTRSIGAVVLTYIVVGALVMLLAATTRGLGSLLHSRHGSASPYLVIPDGALILVSGAIALWAVVAIAIRAAEVWRSTRTVRLGAHRLSIVRAALADAAALRQLHGGGPGCHSRSENENVGPLRKQLHAFVSIGFTLCLASTISAAIEQDIARIFPPYPLISLPVLFGTLGGALLVVGSVGLSYIKLRSDRAPASTTMLLRDYGLLSSLAFIALTGLATLGSRTTPAYGAILVVHLAAVLTLFALVPYSKLMHAVYRTIALVVERAEAAAEEDSVAAQPRSVLGGLRGS